jgi:hypothetical protein
MVTQHFFFIYVPGINFFKTNFRNPIFLFKNNPMQDILSANESAFSLFSRMNKKPLFLSLKFFKKEFPTGMRSGTTVEFIGSSNVGKSEVLLNILIQCILPLSLEGIGSGVIFFDIEGKWDISRVIQILEHHYDDFKKISPEETTLEKFTQECLSRLLVISPKDHSQLILAISYLDKILQGDSRYLFLCFDGNPIGDKNLSESSRNKYKLITKKIIDLVNNYNLILFSTRLAPKKNTEFNNTPNLWSDLFQFRFQVWKNIAERTYFVYSGVNAYPFRITNKGIDFL